MALTYPVKETRLPGHITLDVVDGNGSSQNIQFKLPLPQGLSFADGAVFENADLGLKGTLLQNTGPDVSQSTETGEDTSSAADKQEGPNPNKKGTAEKVLDDVVSRFGGNLGRAGVGVSPNPNTRAIFRQVNLRTFQLSFKMIPASTKEAKNIKNIIEEFRAQLYPEAQGYGEGEKYVTAFKFPNLFEMKVHLGDSVVEELKFLPAYLTNMTTTYNSGTNAVIAKDGGDFSFAETDLSLTFLEFRALFTRNGKVEYTK